MKNRSIPLLFFFFFAIGNFSQAQTKNRLPCINKKFSIVVHVVKDSLHRNGIFAPSTPATITVQVQRTIDSLNAHFAAICVSFEVCEYRYIDNYWYLNPSPTVGSQNQFHEMQVLYNANNRINIYYANYGPLVDSTIAKIASANTGGIVLSSVLKKDLIQSMGKYFGLSTTVGIGGELVNGSNSLTTGDKIADTPADPSGSVDFNCKFISLEKDANGKYYDPIVGNAMSPYSSCLCNSPYAFTHDQYLKMANTYLLNPIAW